MLCSNHAVQALEASIRVNNFTSAELDEMLAACEEADKKIAARARPKNV